MTDEKFFAWLDGELTAEDAAQVAAAVAADPQLGARAAQHRALAGRLQSAFAPIARAPVPERVAAALQAQPSTVLSFAAARESRQARAAPLWKQAAAIAATLVLGIMIGTTLLPQSSSPIATEAGELVAAASLEQALNTRLASAPSPNGPRIGLSFRASSGRICRSFTNGPASGLACHHGGGEWRIRALLQSPEGQQSEFRMAAGPDPALAAMIDDTIAGEPFDAEQEKAAKARGWR